MKNLTVVIFTRNEEKNIEECIRSARLLTEKIVDIDTESADQTLTIAKQLNVKTYSFPNSSYVEPARGFGIKKAETEWVFILDADERMTKELANEILKKIRDDDQDLTHYKIPRKNIFGSVKWLKHGGWWPDYQIRLLNKKYFKLWPTEIHSTPRIDGSLGYFKNPLLHFFHGDFTSMVEKTIAFEDIESDLLYKTKRQVNTFTFFRKFLGELYRRFIKHVGFLDGEIGIIESIYQAFSKTITYLYLYEKSRSLRSLP